MQLFIFEDVLADYTYGMAAIAAKNLKAAQQIAFEEFGSYRNSTFAEFLEHQPGFQTPTGVYSVGKGVEAGVRHHVYGGG